MAHYAETVVEPGPRVRAEPAGPRPWPVSAYVPDELGKGLPEIGVEARAAAEDALAVLARADERIAARGRYLNHLLIRSEASRRRGSGQSDRSEATGDSRVAARGSGRGAGGGRERSGDGGRGWATSDPARPLTAADIVDLHHVVDPHLPKGLRTEQNWVGGPG